MVKTIVVSDFVDACITNEQGEIIYTEILKAIEKEGGATISMDNIDILTSSFLNSAIVPITDEYSFEWFKCNIKVINGRRHIIKMIKDRINFAYTGNQLINNN